MLNVVLFIMTSRREYYVHYERLDGKTEREKSRERESMYRPNFRHYGTISEIIND